MVECLHESGMEFDSKLGMEYNFVEHQMSDGVELELHAKDSVTEPCNINEIGPHACNDVMDVANGSHLNMDIVKEMPPGKSGLNWVAIDSTEPQDPVERHMNDVYDVTEFKPNSESEVKEVELECCMGTHEGFVAGLETEIPIDVDVVPEIEMNKYDIKRYTESCTPEVLEGDSIKLFDSVKDLKEAHDGICHESCTKLERRDFSNSDSCSEVSNPIPSPKQVISNSTISSLPSDVIDGFHGGCGEITSVCSLNSGAVAEEERTRCKVESVSTSHVVLEIPKHLRPTGIRKITFKFNKRKESCGNEQSVAVKPMAQGDICGGLHGKHKSVCADTCNGSHKHASNNVENSETNASVDWSEFNDTHHPSSCVPNRELKMSKKIVPDNYPSNVKKLLSTRILEGARVKYISTNGEKQLPGVIKGCGYLCGCSLCNFSKVVTAYEFEIHAGSKTRLPNNHIHLENGKPIYSIIQELRMAPLGAVEEVIKSVAGSSVNEEYFQLWKSNLEHSNTINSMDSLCQSQQSTLHHSMISNNSEDISSPASFCNLPLPPSNQQSHTEVPVERKRLIKKPRHCFSSSSWEHKRTAEGGTRKRDNDLHKLLFMPNGLPDGTSLAYYSKGKMILGGYKQGNGIVCSCCNTEISPSQFEAHAGWAAKRQPYRHIYTSTGLTLHDVALMLANGQNLSTSGSDDMCTICGDGGELAVCNGCPRAFHAACLGSQHVPADDWHCPYCRDKFGPARKASSDSRSIIVRLKRVVKAPEDVPGGCVVCRIQDFSATKFDDRTVIICDQCEKEYHVGCLRQCGLCDLKELPEDKWFCRDECHKIFEALQSLANSGPEMIPTPVFASIYKKHTTLGLSDESKNETHIQWRVLSGKSRFPEHLLHLSRAAAIFRECFDPIVTTSGRDLIPVMVYGRNISGQEFYGMYCVVLLVESVVVSAALLRIFGQEVAELPLVATARENQGKGYFQALFSCIERFLSSLNVKLLVLPAAEEAEAMWTKKLGFRRTSNEQMLKYTRDLQLTIFAGTSLLEKEVQHIAD